MSATLDILRTIGSFYGGVVVGSLAMLFALSLCRSAKLGDQGMGEMVRSDSLDVQRERCVECAL